MIKLAELFYYDVSSGLVYKVERGYSYPVGSIEKIKHQYKNGLLNHWQMTESGESILKKPLISRKEIMAYVRIAKELCYPQSVIDALMLAETNYEVSKIMTTARKEAC